MSDVLLKMQMAALELGRVEWGATHEVDAEMHGKQLEASVNLTAKHFGQTGKQKMHGLYVDGTSIVLCHTGTSPNSPTHARIMAALWNKFVADAEIELANTPQSLAQEGE